LQDKQSAPEQHIETRNAGNLHEERAVKANLPASTSSLSFFITSFAHCFRLGLLMSLMRWVGAGGGPCAPAVCRQRLRLHPVAAYCASKNGF
jgi:hypothetical protein